MTYHFSTDFNTVDNQSTQPNLIPVGTLAKVSFTIKPGGFGTDGWLTQSSSSGAIYLNAEFTVMEGPYTKRKIFQRIGIQGTKPDDMWGKNGRSLLRAILESARNINPKDNADQAVHARQLNHVGELNGAVCAVRIGIEEDKTGQFDPKNKVLIAITPDHKSYQEIMTVATPIAITSTALNSWNTR